MAITPLTVTIDINPSYKKIPAVYVSQLDNNLRELAITVQDGGVNYNVASSGYDVYIEGTKPDMHGFSYDVTDIGGTVAGSVITVPMQTQMTCVKGMVSTEIVLKSGSDRIGSANFLLVVERAGLAEDVDVSETDIPAYIDGAQRAAEAAEQAKDDAVEAKNTAVAVAASIPEDYTTLSNDVDDLKNAFDSVKDLTPMSKTFEQGTAYGNVGSQLVGDSTQTTRCRMWKKAISDVLVKANDGYIFYVYFTNSSGIIQSKTSNSVTEYVIPSSNQFDVSITVQKPDNSNISPSEAESNVLFTQPILDKISNIDGDIDSLENRMLSIDGKIEINPDDFVIGAISISTSGWQVISSNKRVSTDINKPISLKAGDIIKLSDYTNARFYVGYRRSDDTYGTPAQWFTRDLAVPETGDYVITMSNITEVVLSSKSDLLDLLELIDKDSLALKINAMLGGMFTVPASMAGTQVYTESYTTTKAVQGLCTDGTYLYQAVMEQLGNDGAGTTIKKIALSDYSLVSSETGVYGHMNDMTYDGTYLLSVYKTSANYNVVTRFNPSTLAKVDDIDLSAVASTIGGNVTFIGIAYASDINRYIIAAQDGYSLVGFAFLKSDWTLEKYIKVIPQSDVMQCIAYADGIIYAVIHRAGIPERIYAYDMHGNVINYTENIFGYESEGIAIVDSDFYLSYNPSSYKALYIYKAVPTFTNISIAETMAKYNLNY